MNKEYVALQMSSGFEKGGFKTKREAWEYILSRDCDDCKRLRVEGSPFGGACSAEWEIETREQLNIWRAESDADTPKL